MLVSELVSILQQYDQNLEVHAQYQDGGGVYSGSTELTDVWEEDGIIIVV